MAGLIQSARAQDVVSRICVTRDLQRSHRQSSDWELMTLRGRLKTVSGRRQEITIRQAVEDPVGSWEFTVHLDDLEREDLVGSLHQRLELDLRDGRRFSVACDGIDFVDRIVTFSTRDSAANPRHPGTPPLERSA